MMTSIGSLAVADGVVTAIVNLASAVIGGVVVAALGIAVWRRQVRAKARFDVARGVRRAVIAFRRGTKHVRFPMKGEWEWAGRPGRDEEREAPTPPSPTTVHHRDEVWAYQNRFRVLQDARDELDSAELEAEVILGPEIVALLEPLRTRGGHLVRKVQQYLGDLSVGRKTDDKVQAVVFDRSEGEKLDPFAQAIEDAIRAVNEHLRPHMQIDGGSLQRFCQWVKTRIFSRKKPLA